MSSHRRFFFSAVFFLCVSGCGPPDGALEWDVTGAPTPDVTPNAPSISVLVTSAGDVPVSDAVVMLAGSSKYHWIMTGSDGRADLPVADEAFINGWVMAGKRGWYSAGVELSQDALPTTLVSIEIRRIETDDNPEYIFEEGGSRNNMGGTGQCMHCHVTIGDQWNLSAHRDAISNPRTRDLFNGSALLASQPSCEALGGWWIESSVPGTETGERQWHCTVGKGVLPDLNGVCGGEGQLACDDLDLERSELQNFGQCGNCHGASIPGMIPDKIDLNDASGYIYKEGVTCDLCHKIADVTVEKNPGVGGTISLLRPGIPSSSPLIEWEPIQYAPYPDVLNGLMGGSYQPQFRESLFCAGCHEHQQPALAPEDADLVDSVKWPDGLPIQTTWSEWKQGLDGSAMTCQNCHMPPLDEDCSTVDLADAGHTPSVALGWIRPLGEVRNHDFPGSAELGPASVTLKLNLQEEGGEIVVQAEVGNGVSGHALPTGEPLRQVAVLFEATLDGAPIAASGGWSVPDVGGYLSTGIIGDSVELDGATLTFTPAPASSTASLAVHFVRPTGEWNDYAGAGVGWHSQPERSPEEKGLALFEFVGQTAATLQDDGTIDLENLPADVVPGDVAYLVGEGQWAGAPGWLYSKVLVDRNGKRGVHHYRAVDIASDNRISLGGTGFSEHRFPSPADGSVLEVKAEVIYRRQSHAVVSEYGWPHEDLIFASETAHWPPDEP